MRMIFEDCEYSEELNALYESKDITLIQLESNDPSRKVTWCIISELGLLIALFKRKMSASIISKPEKLQHGMNSTGKTLKFEITVLNESEKVRIK